MNIYTEASCTTRRPLDVIVKGGRQKSGLTDPGCDNKLSPSSPAASEFYITTGRATITMIESKSKRVADHESETVSTSEHITETRSNIRTISREEARIFTNQHSAITSARTPTSTSDNASNSQYLRPLTWYPGCGTMLFLFGLFYDRQ